MGRYGNYPKTIEDCLTISIKKLNEWNYLTNGIKSGTISWSTNGVAHSKIDIKVIFTDLENCIILDYKCNGEPINYKVRIESLASNLGKGTVKYFVCPRTGKYCRKLYLHNSYFLHREAFKGMFYQKQLESKKSRNLFRVFDKIMLSDEVYEERYKKYFKTHYKGLPTKKYLKLENKIRVAESYPKNALESLMLM